MPGFLDFQLASACIRKTSVPTVCTHQSPTSRFSGLRAACAVALILRGRSQRPSTRLSSGMPSTDVMLVDGAVPHWSRESAVNARVYQCLGVDKRRCRKLNKVPMAKDATGAVIYWMSRDQRAEDNWALLYAQKLAIQRSASLHVVFCLVPKFGDATIRQFDFLLKGLKEVAATLAAKKIPFHLKLGKAADEIPTLLDQLEAKAVVCDMSPLRVLSPAHLRRFDRFFRLDATAGA
eukprot:symbB.v1.2.030397.t1/scaffold3420.1/size57189/5